MWISWLKTESQYPIWASVGWIRLSLPCFLTVAMWELLKEASLLAATTWTLCNWTESLTDDWPAYISWNHRRILKELQTCVSGNCAYNTFLAMANVPQNYSLTKRQSRDSRGERIFYSRKFKKELRKKKRDTSGTILQILMTHKQKKIIF